MAKIEIQAGGGTPPGPTVVKLNGQVITDVISLDLHFPTDNVVTADLKLFGELPLDLVVDDAKVYVEIVPREGWNVIADPIPGGATRYYAVRV